MRGPRLSDWGAEPATTHQVSGIFSGTAVAMLGMAFISISIVDIRGAECDIALMIAAVTFVAVYGAVSFQSVASLVRSGDLRGAEAQEMRNGSRIDVL